MPSVHDVRVAAFATVPPGEQFGALSLAHLAFLEKLNKRGFAPYLDKSTEDFPPDSVDEAAILEPAEYAALMAELQALS